MKHLLPKLADRLQQFQPLASKIPVPAFKIEIPKSDTQVINHAWFWPRVGSFFKPKDVIVTETGKKFHVKSMEVPEPILLIGTSNFGIVDVQLPVGAMLVSQVLWGSIGWSVGRSQLLTSMNLS